MLLQDLQQTLGRKSGTEKPFKDTLLQIPRRQGVAKFNEAGGGLWMGFEGGSNPRAEVSKGHIVVGQFKVPSLAPNLTRVLVSLRECLYSSIRFMFGVAREL